MDDSTGYAMKTDEADDYEQLYALLHAYRFGTIGFLELLDAFEELLQIASNETKFSNSD